MDHLIIRSLQDRASVEEVRELHAWREQSPENERRYRRLAELWALTGAASAGVRATRHDEGLPDPSSLIARAEGEASERNVPHTAADLVGSGEAKGRAVPSLRARTPTWVRAAKIGALAAGFAAVGFGLARITAEDAAPVNVLAESEIRTGAGEMTTVTLVDGTSIRVGPRTHLRLGQQGRDRVAWLDGRAFFGVEADPSRTFTVQTRHGDAVVHGTRFEVRSEDDEFRVLVVDGRVQVTAGGGEADLREGEMSQSPAGAPPSTSRVEDVYALLDWMGNSLVFQRTPLRRAIREIERRYGVEVVLESPGLADLAVTATFTDQSIEDVMLVLCGIIEGRCSVDGERVRIGTDAPGTVGRAG